MTKIYKVQFFHWTFLVLSLLLLCPNPVSAGEVLARVQARGAVRCGVSEGITGFSLKNATGRWVGLDADFCRAVAAAAIGNAEKVDFVPLSAPARFLALRSGEIDLLVRNTTWTLGREAGLHVHFTGVLYYDGQGFLVPHKNNVTQLANLNGATICVEKGTTHEPNLADYFQGHGLTYQPLVSESLADVKEAFFAGRCQAYTSDRSQLAAIRSQAPGGAEAYVILPEQISKEPLGPAVGWGDEEWFTLVKWVLFTLIAAEESGITHENVRAMVSAETDDAMMARFLSTNRTVSKALSVDPEWGVRAVESVGNYGEMFERNLGSQSSLQIERGLNRLWTQGGLLYAPPLRY